jgi:hypothetical protein
MLEADELDVSVAYSENTFASYIITDLTGSLTLYVHISQKHPAKYSGKKYLLNTCSYN